MKLLKTASLIAILAGPVPAVAQAVDSKAEGPYVVGSVGRQGFSAFDSGAPVFGGWMFGLGAGYVAPRGWFLEGAADQLVDYHSDDSEDNGNVTTLTARVGKRWGGAQARFRPYVAFAIGLAHDAWDDGSGRDITATGTVMGAVFGGDIRASERWFVRPEVSILGGMGEIFTKATVGIGFRF